MLYNLLICLVDNILQERATEIEKASVVVEPEKLLPNCTTVVDKSATLIDGLNENVSVGEPNYKFLYKQMKKELEMVGNERDALATNRIMLMEQLQKTKQGREEALAILKKVFSKNQIDLLSKR